MLDKFVQSKGFKDVSKELSGSIIKKKSLNTALIRKIEDNRTRKEYEQFYKMVNKAPGEVVVILTKPSNNRERKKVNDFLIHEYIHLLLIQNNIEFKNIGAEQWVLDEGLVIFMEYYIHGDSRKIMQAKSEDKYTSICLDYAKKWAKILNNKKPKERKRIILNFYRKIKEKHGKEHLCF